MIALTPKTISNLKARGIDVEHFQRIRKTWSLQLVRINNNNLRQEAK